MKTLPENWSPTVLEGLYLLGAKRREKRLGPLECIQEAYDIFATDEVKAGKKLIETDLDERIPAQVFEAARHFGWIADPSKRTRHPVRLIPDSYAEGAITNSPVTERIPGAELVESIGDFRVTARFKAQFLDGWLAGRRSYWRGKMYAQAQDTTAAAEVGAPEAGRPDESTLGRNVERFDDRKIRISQGLQTAETPAGAGGSQPWPPLLPDLGEAVGGETEHAEVGSEPLSREERLQAFIVAHPGTTLADIKYSARVHTSEFQDWRNDRLKQESVMSQRIEDVLSGATQLKKKPPKTHKD